MTAQNLNIGHKKSGTAILLFRQSRLWYCLFHPNSNTEAHAVYIMTYAYVNTHTNIHHEHLSVALSWIKMFEIYQISIDQNKALKTLIIMSLPFHTLWTLPSAWAEKKLHFSRSAVGNSLQNYCFFLRYANFSHKFYGLNGFWNKNPALGIGRATVLCNNAELVNPCKARPT